MWQKHCQWITATLRTIVSNRRDRDVLQISLRASGILHALPYDFVPGTGPAGLRNAIGETKYQEYLELDHLLPRLWESRSVRLKVAYDVPYWLEEDGSSCMEILFPEVTAGGAIDLIKHVDWGF